MNGQFISVYKPVGPTSFDVVAAVRRASGIKRVGHAGTLDPLASGVLVVAVGREATKQLAAIVNKSKEYVATCRMGMTSTTDDEEGDKTAIPNPVPPTDHKIRQVLATFTGTISQMPPQYSALKINGKPAYKLARQGKTVTLKPREVRIESIEVLHYSWPEVTFKITCGPGVYIRALARDLGETLGVGAYLTALERTRVGQFTKEGSVRLDELTTLFTAK